MARRYLVPINLSKQELQNARIQNLATAPAATASDKGLLYYNTTENTLYWWDGSSWRSASGAAFGAPSALTVGGGNDAGTSVNAARADHRHALPAFGTTAGTFAEGNDPRFNAPTTPSGPAGGDLAGTYPNPTLSTAIQNYLRDRGNHTGSQTASTISDLAAVVKAYRLDEFAAPSAPVSFGNQRLTNLATPTADTDAASKGYVDGVATGLDLKASVRVATTANINLTGLQTIDGVTLSAGDRVLVKNQTVGANNGIYVAASSGWSRATDADTTAEVTPGMFVFVEAGTAQADTGWVLTNDAVILGNTALAFTQFSSAGEILPGNGLSKSGNTLSVQPVANGGILVGAGGVSIDTALVPRKVALAVGVGGVDPAATQFTLTHGLGTRDVTVQLYDTASPFDTVEADVERTSVNAVTVRFAQSTAAGAYRAVIVG